MGTAPVRPAPVRKLLSPIQGPVEVIVHYKHADEDVEEGAAGENNNQGS